MTDRVTAVVVSTAIACLVAACGGGRDVPTVDVAEAGAGVTAPAVGDVLTEGGWPTVAAFVAATADEGDATVVNLFGSWCEPCAEELPLLLEASASTPGVRWLGVAVEDVERNARPFVEEFGVTWPTVLDLDATTHTALGGRVMPTTAFFDADGTLVEVVDGILDQQRLSIALARIAP